MSLSGEQRIFTEHIGMLIHFAYSIGIQLTFGRARDTVENQKILYDKGLSKTMDSYHLKALAVDFNFFIDGELTYDKDRLECLGVFWETLDNKNTWGGRWKWTDTPHFQRSVR